MKEIEFSRWLFEGYFFHIFGIPSSSRHEKCCQILQTLFWVFQYSKNSQWSLLKLLFLTKWAFWAPRPVLKRSLIFLKNILLLRVIFYLSMTKKENNRLSANLIDINKCKKKIHTSFYFKLYFLKSK